MLRYELFGLKMTIFELFRPAKSAPTNWINERE